MQDYDEDYINDVYGGFGEVQVEVRSENDDDEIDDMEPLFEFDIKLYPEYYQVCENFRFLTLVVAYLISTLATWHLLCRYTLIELSFTDCLVGVASFGWFFSLLFNGVGTIKALAAVLGNIAVFFDRINKQLWIASKLAKYPFPIDGLSAEEEFWLAQVCHQIEKSSDIADRPDFYESLLEVVPLKHNLPLQVHDYFVKRNEDKIEDDIYTKKYGVAQAVAGEFHSFLRKHGLPLPVKGITTDQMTRFMEFYPSASEEERINLCEQCNIEILKNS